MDLKNTKFISALKGQAGVSLLLSILVLSSVMAVCFSLATILLVEINNSGDLMRSNVSFYAIFAQSEDSIYQVRRGISNNDGNISSPPINNVSVSGYISSTSSPYQVIKVPTKNNYSNPLVIPFLDFRDISSGSGYTKAVLSLLDSNNYGVGYKMIYYDMDNLGASSSPFSGTLTPTNSSTTLSSLDAGGGQYDLQLINNSTSDDQYVGITTYKNIGGVDTPYGLPYYNQKILNISGQNGDVTRQEHVVVPNRH